MTTGQGHTKVTTFPLPGDTSVWRFMGSLEDLDIFCLPPTVRVRGREVEVSLRVSDCSALLLLLFAERAWLEPNI